MDLWTEFEGITIDSAFSLNKLLQTEGRSAFFSTFNARGESVLIRIIECHFDEDEILARWRGVQTLGHPNFLRIDRFGQFLIEADDITAVYAVFERVDANLGQVLEQGRLSAADATQIGLSVVSALETLHANGFVHRHIEPRNVFAIGENIKLRSDLIRETPEGEAGFEARRRDVHDLALMLMQVLIGTSRYAPRQTALPAPFDEIVRYGMSGEWGLSEIKAALSVRRAPKLPSSTRPVAESVPAAKQLNFEAEGFSSNAPARPASRNDERPMSAASEAAVRANLFRSGRVRFDLRNWVTTHQQLVLRWVAAGVFLGVVVFFGWVFTHHLFGGHTAATAQPVPATHTATAPPHSQPARLKSNASQAASASRLALQGKTQWRVVAFTYNREDQAKKRASSLAQKRPDLRPEVFSPTGRAPWLVTIGGALERDAAYSLAHRAASFGLPRDTYAQNYTAR